ncbi:MAG TPA: alcohol dehydrogenase-like regulatory protein ErcA [Smithellaceae bacterium]|nr:alcohol dehydrogenase-like regulatory protein ErcA [Smithellaceae bacterium]
MTSINSIELRKFVAPEFVFGTDARFLAGRYAKNLGARKVLVVTDPGVIRAGWTAQVISSLEKENLPYSVFSSISSNPRAQEVMEGAELYRQEGCNVIVATGGGSPMDCAKGIGIVDSNGSSILEFEGVDQVPIPGPPLICIPTTAGSSADVSQFAIINNSEKQVKIAIVSKTVVPDAALIDPVTTLSMDVHLTACTGMDALTHAIEAYVSDASSPITDLHALEAVRLVSSSLLALLSDTGNVALRSNMMLASLHAGLAFSNASLGAVHAMAHALGGLLDLAHGHCNSILLPHVMDYNFDAVAGRYCSVGDAMGLRLEGMTSDQKKKAVFGEVKRLQHEAGVDQSLSQIGASRSDISQLAQNAMLDACMVTNPRKPGQKDIEAIYEKAF